jgi:hypothetical protein
MAGQLNNYGQLSGSITECSSCRLLRRHKTGSDVARILAPDAATNRNYDLWKNYNYLLNFLVFGSVIQNVLRAKNHIFFIYNIHFSVPWTLPPGEVAPLTAPHASAAPLLTDTCVTYNKRMQWWSVDYMESHTPLMPSYSYEVSW